MEGERVVDEVLGDHMIILVGTEIWHVESNG